MDSEKNKPSVPHLGENLKNNHETNGNEMHLIIQETLDINKETLDINKETLDINKEIIEQNRKILLK